MSIIVVLSIIFIHWVADFIFQAEVWANNKSKSLKPLLKHTITYSLIWLLPMCFVFGLSKEGVTTEWIVWSTLYFGIITFIFHTITDYFTSKIVSKRFADQYYGSPIPNFGAFTIIGFDQVLHYVQLFLTYYFLSL